MFPPLRARIESRQKETFKKETPKRSNAAAQCAQAQANHSGARSKLSGPTGVPHAGIGQLQCSGRPNETSIDHCHSIAQSNTRPSLCRTEGIGSLFPAPKRITVREAFPPTASIISPPPPASLPPPPPLPPSATTKVRRLFKTDAQRIFQRRWGGH